MKELRILCDSSVIVFLFSEMEKCLRKKSVRSFCRDFISECIETKDKDVIMRCSDGDIAFHRYLLYFLIPLKKENLTVI